MSRTLKFFAIFFTIVLLVTSCNNSSNIYYIDSISGDDNYSGTSRNKPWKSIEKINEHYFRAGDQILFKRDQQWKGTLMPLGSGVPLNPIVIGAYDQGNDPIIHGGGQTNCSPDSSREHYCTILLTNQEYWEIKDIEITNYNPIEENGLTLNEWEKANITNYADVVHPSPLEEERTSKTGILILARNYGAVHNLEFSSLHIHGINGNIKTKHNGGIYFDIAGDDGERPTYFDGVQIDSCYIHDVDRTGISNSSYYEKRSSSTNINWTPSLNFKISNNRFERTGANAVIMRVANKPIIESNLFDHCAIKESGNAFFNFNTDSALMQYNESRYTKYNVGDHDAGGIDSDFRTKGTILQYNYIHDNDFGPLITGGQTKTGGFNIGTIVRFNIFLNDGIVRDPSDGDDRLDFSLKISGNAIGTRVYNNIIHLTPKQENRALVYHRNWGAYPNNSQYFNNIIINESEGTYLELTKSQNNSIRNNIIVGNAIAGWIGDQQIHKTQDIFKSTYLIQGNSPAAFNGENADMPNLDYYQNAIINQPVSIGIHMVAE